VSLLWQRPSNGVSPLLSMHEEPRSFGYDVSVIVLSYNTVSYLRRALESVSAGFQRYTTEIIVVDNGSTDGTLLDSLTAAASSMTTQHTTSCTMFAKRDREPVGMCCLLKGTFWSRRVIQPFARCCALQQAG
jgi:hypothetical protein